MEDQIKKRNLFIAFLLSIFSPGLGQFYNGQLKKGALLFSLVIIFLLLCSVFNVASTYLGFLFIAIILILFKIYILTDAMIIASKNKKYVLKSYNRWYYYVSIFFILAIFSWFCDVNEILKIQNVIIPTTANLPTLEVNDRIIVDENAYKETEPEYGDLICYTGEMNELLISRVLGKPLDEISVNNNDVIINDKACNSRLLKDTIINSIKLNEFEVVMPNDYKHLIYKDAESSNEAIANKDLVRVPDGHYYVVGDNRDNSIDSRYIGTLSKDKIIGKVKYIFWSDDFSRVNSNIK